MKDILWTIYLSIMIFIGIFLIYDIRFDTKTPRALAGWALIIEPILIAIWYMYFLH